MQGFPLPHTATPVSMIVRSSAIVGNRQSQWLSNPPVCVLPSELTQFPTPVAPRFSVARKLVKAVPSGGLDESLQFGNVPTHQLYVLSLSCTTERLYALGLPNRVVARPARR